MPTRPIKIELYRPDPLGLPEDGGVGWRWTARRGGRIIAASSEAYTERIAAVRNIALVFGIPWLVREAHGKRVIDVRGIRSGDGVLLQVKTR